MNWLTRAKDFFRELRDSSGVLSTPRDERPVVVYSEDTFTYNQFEGFLDALIDHHQIPLTYVTSDPRDPLFRRHPATMKVYYVNQGLNGFMRRLDSDLLITTMPDLGRLHIDRPRKETCCLYIFHSLNSIHEVYRHRAFDNYDVFFCTGPHHRMELEKHFSHYKLPHPKLYDVGYYKLDRVGAAYRSYTKKLQDEKTVLIAPSWGDRNLLSEHGDAIVGQLRSLGLKVIIRPHPCFFLPIYPAGRDVVARLERRFSADPLVIFEKSIDSEDSFYEADLMISDFSGAAFEYALGTLRPVLFVDVPRKTKNPDWQVLGLPTFEDAMRSRVGHLVSPEEVPRVGQLSAGLLESPREWEGRLKDLRESVIYNYGKSAEIGAAIISDLLRQPKPAALCHTG